MILYKTYDHVGSIFHAECWGVLPSAYKIHKGSFNSMFFKIHDIEYKVYSEELQAEYERELVWMSLKRG